MRPDEHAVMKSADLADGQMRQVELGELKVLLARVNGAVHAVTGTCPHYGAPLAEGLLCGARLRCPWHQGCFDVTTGDLLEPPPLESLRRYEVREEGGDVIVRVPAGEGPYRDPSRATPNVADKGRFVILGGGAAGASAAQTLREAGFGGTVRLVSPEPQWPYDRPGLSKNYLAGLPLDHPTPLQPAEFYEKHRIERVTRRAVGVDRDQRVVNFDGGDTEPFDALLLAPGGSPRKLGVTGEDLPGVFTLRSLSDADAILGAVESADRVVLVGSGFIGMEAAASLRHRGLDVTIVTPEQVPMASKLGEPIGRMFQQVHVAQGVKFHLGRKVTAFEGDGKLKSVTLDDGTRLDTPLAIVAVGVRPATEFLRGSFPLNDDGSLTADRTMQVAGSPGVYAAGDVARFPSPQTGEPIRVEHWRVAQQLGRVAAFNMAGVPRVYDEVPYFWTFQYDVGLDYVGHADRWDAIHVDGDIGKREFLAYYLRGDRILAVGGCNRGDQALAIAELMRTGKMPGAEVLRRGAVDWKALLRG